MQPKIHKIAVTALLTISLIILGCSDDTPTTPQSGTKGSINIVQTPDSLNAAWTLTLPTQNDTSGTGSFSLYEMPTGNYSLTWDNVPDWIRPPDQVQTLSGAETITFSGVYELENPFTAAVIGTDSTLEVMTWNVEHFPKESAVTTNWVIKVIESLDVDIIAMQEIESSFQFDNVVNGLDGWSGFKANSAGYDIDLAYIYRDGGALEIESIQEIMANESRPFPRSPLLLLGTYNDKPIAVINNHLKCCGNGTIDEADFWDEETRRRDACIMLEEYVLNNISERRVCIAGDFNDELTDAADANVFANFLGNPSEWMATDLAIAEGDASGWSYPSWPSHLDHIIVNQALFDAVGGVDSSVQVVPLMSYLPGGWSQYDREISDHLPVVLKLVP